MLYGIPPNGRQQQLVLASARLLRWCAVVELRHGPLSFVAFLGPGFRPLRPPFRHNVRLVIIRGTVYRLRLLQNVRVGLNYQVGHVESPWSLYRTLRALWLRLALVVLDHDMIWPTRSGQQVQNHDFD